MNRFAAAAIVVGTLMSGAASAATISQLSNFGGGSGSSTIFSESFSFNQYSGTDTLVGVELSYQIDINGSLSTDQCAFFQDCDPAEASISLVGASIFGALNVSDTDSSGVTNNTNATQFGNFAPELSGTFAFTNLSDFIGTGIINDLSVTGTYLGFANTIFSLYTGTANLVYTTAPAVVPLPATLPMLALGLGGIAVAAGRRRRRRGA